MNLKNNNKSFIKKEVLHDDTPVLVIIITLTGGMLLIAILLTISKIGLLRCMHKAPVTTAPLLGLFIDNVAHSGWVLL